MKKDIFYNEVRALFGDKLSATQVSGMEEILSVGLEYPLAYVSYALATTLGETGGAMVPVEENLRYSAGRIPRVFSKERRQGNTAKSLAYNPEGLANAVYGGAWGANNLGNYNAGDGWRFRGRGLPQVTGRNNYEKLAAICSLDLTGNPDLMLSSKIAVRASLFGAMEHGIYTGKSFKDYLPKKGRASRAKFKAARRIINGQFDADKYAEYAMQFQNALVKAGFEKRVDSIIDKTVKAPNIFTVIMRILKLWLNK